MTYIKTNMGYLWDNYGIASYDVPQGSFVKLTSWLVEGVTTGCITPLVYGMYKYDICHRYT